MTIDIDKLEALVTTVTSGAAAQKSADPVIRNMGRLEFDDACKQYLRATNPVAILELIAEVRALRADAARLDFLIDNSAHVWSMGLGWHVTKGHSDDPENLEPWDAHCTSAREAIDAARARWFEPKEAQ
jgi:hypothetical protein